MPSKLPCINPFCTQTFSPEEVEGASQLQCPKCGATFEVAPGAVKKPAPPSGTKPKAPPPLPKTVSPPVPPQPPSPADVPATVSFDFHSTAEMVTPPTRRRARKRRPVGWIVGVLVGAAGIALAIWGGMGLRHFFNEKPANEEPALGAPYNARFTVPGKPWQRDKELQQRLHVHIGMKSPENNNLAILFKDYKNRMPSDGEMLDEALGKLRSYFQGLESEPLSRDEEARLAEHSAQVCKFQGEDSEHVMMNGECYMTAFRGYGYWFFTWAPLSELENDREAIHAEWARLRQHLSLLDGRKGWKEKPREMERIGGKMAKYSLSYVKGAWTPERPAEDDPNIDLLLKGHEPDPENRPLAAKAATVQVFVLPKQANLKSATAAALDYVKQRERKLYERTTWEPVKDRDGAVDRDADIGSEHGHLSKLHVKSTEDLERFLSIAVVNRPNGVVVLVGDCLWERRDFWDQEFSALFKSFTVR